jgi:hypothetical protein
MSNDRECLESLVGQVVAVDAVIQGHSYLDADNRGHLIATSTLGPVLVTTSSGRHLIDHLHCRNCNQLRSYPPASRIRFSARVRQYQRADGSTSWGLSAPFGIELVQAPPCLKTAAEK